MQSQNAPPPGYRFIDYARSDGSAYVDLAIVFDPTDEIEIFAAIEDLTSDKFLVAPSIWNNDGNRFAMVGGQGDDFGVGYGKNVTLISHLSPRKVKNNSFNLWAYGNKRFILGSSTFNISYDDFLRTTSNIRLFFGYNSATTGKIKYYWHKKADGTECYIRPIQKVNTGDVEMYDTISKTIMARTGTLTAPQ